MKKILIFLVCLLFSINATASCPKQKVLITFKYKIGKVIYNYSLSRHEFAKKSPKFRSNPDNLLGLTVSRLDVSGSSEGASFRHRDKHCAGISKVNFEIGFDKFNVYVDKKYRQGTCERRVIKAHEDEHVTIYKEGMYFFAPDIKKALRLAVKNLKPEVVYSQADVDRVCKKQFEYVIKKMQPLLTHINKKLEEKQGQIDTPESYARENKKCKNW
ncbi:MAG: hypothetical protein J6V53_01055 [Alphaproteobacteria bacterium]|nr:hypothetical protein [Alphaproteobacteria bacterium]